MDRPDLEAAVVTGTVVERPFLHVFSDAIALLLLAEENNDSDVQGVLSRSSLLHSVLSLESAANCCLREHPYPKRLLDKCDTFSTIDKFEFVLATMDNGVTFDRGSRAVQAVQELVTIRNHYVHPKAKTGPLIEDAFRDGYIVINSDKYPITGISDRPINWKACDARKSLLSLIEFLDAFFLDWCKLSLWRIEKLLVSNATFDTQLLGHESGSGSGLMCDMRAADMLLKANMKARFIDFEQWRHDSAARVIAK